MLAVAVSAVSKVAVVVVLIDYVVASLSNITLVPVEEGEGKRVVEREADLFKFATSTGHDINPRRCRSCRIVLARVPHNIFPLLEELSDFEWRWSLADKIQSKFSASYESTTIVPASILIDEDLRWDVKDHPCRWLFAHR